MQNTEGIHHHHHHSDTDSVGSGGGGDRTSFSGPLNKRGGGKKSARFTLPDDTATSPSAAAAAVDDYVEITLDLHEDSVAVHSVKAAGGGDVEDPDLKLLARGLEKKSSFGSSVVRNASSRFRQVKRLASLTRNPPPVKRLDRSKSAAAQALKGLKFISKTDGGAAWTGVEKRFDELTSSTNGMLPRSLFGECIGKYKKITTN